MEKNWKMETYEIRSIMSIINYNSGLRDGVSESFWENGKLK